MKADSASVGYDKRDICYCGGCAHTRIPSCPPMPTSTVSASSASAAHAFCGPFPEQSEDERTLRYMLALRCGEPGELYGDDGELQLGSFPHPIDFRRDSVQEIRRKLDARGMAKLIEQQRAASTVTGAP